MLIGKIDYSVFLGKKISNKIASKIKRVPIQKYNQYTEKRVEQIILTAQEQLETNPRNEMELLAMMDKVGLSNVLEYFKKHKI